MKQSERIIDMHSSIKVMEEKVNNIDKSLHGNGGPGIIQRLRNVENRIWWIVGIGGTVIFFVNLIF